MQSSNVAPATNDLNALAASPGHELYSNDSELIECNLNCIHDRSLALTRLEK